MLEQRVIRVKLLEGRPIVAAVLPGLPLLHLFRLLRKHVAWHHRPVYVPPFSVLLANPQGLIEDTVLELDLLFNVLVNLEIHRFAIEA